MVMGPAYFIFWYNDIFINFWYSQQEEVKDLKEQLNMFEAASCLGVLSQETTRETIHDDSMMDLGIKKTIDFDETPEPIK